MNDQERSFFIQIPPPLENYGLSELNEKCELLEIQHRSKVVTGGIESLINLEDGFKLNHYLRGANRILLLIDSFKCRDFPKLFKKIQTLDYSRLFLLIIYYDVVNCVL